MRTLQILTHSVVVMGKLKQLKWSVVVVFHLFLEYLLIGEQYVVAYIYMTGRNSSCFSDSNPSQFYLGNGVPCSFS